MAIKVTNPGRGTRALNVRGTLASMVGLVLLVACGASEVAAPAPEPPPDSPEALSRAVVAAVARADARAVERLAWPMDRLARCDAATRATLEVDAGLVAEHMTKCQGRLDGLVAWWQTTPAAVAVTDPGTARALPGCGAGVEAVDHLTATVAADPSASARAVDVVVDAIRDGHELYLRLVRCEKWQPPPDESADGPVRSRDGQNYYVDRPWLDAQLDDVTSLLDQARPVPSYQNERRDGTKLIGVRPSSMFRRLELRSGDIIHRANGLLVDDMTVLLSCLRTNDRCELAIERRGEPKTLTYHFPRTE